MLGSSHFSYQEALERQLHTSASNAMLRAAPLSARESRHAEQEDVSGMRSFVTPAPNKCSKCQRLPPKGDFFFKISSDVDHFYGTTSLTRDDHGLRKSLVQRLQHILTQTFSGAQMRVFGSYNSGFSTKYSDLDLDIVMKTTDSSGRARSPSAVLARFAMALTDAGYRQADIQTLFNARVPVIKLYDSRTDLRCDIVHTNRETPCASLLLHDYAMSDERVAPFVCAVKYWSKMRHVGEAPRGSLSSFGFTLMALQYLQTTSPPVVPNFQDPHEKERHRHNRLTGIPPHHKVLNTLPTPPPLDSKLLSVAPPADGTVLSTPSTPARSGSSTDDSVALCVAAGVSIEENSCASNGADSSCAISQRSLPLAPEITFEPHDTQCLGALLLGFFKMYSGKGTFDASTMVVSVRKGSFANRADDDVSGLSRSRSETDPYPALYIEDPFDRTNNVARNVRPDTYSQIEKECSRAFDMILKGYSFSDICYFETGPLSARSDGMSRNDTRYVAHYAMHTPATLIPYQIGFYSPVSGPRSARRPRQENKNKWSIRFDSLPAAVGHVRDGGEEFHLPPPSDVARRRQARTVSKAKHSVSLPALSIVNSAYIAQYDGKFAHDAAPPANLPRATSAEVVSHSAALSEYASSRSGSSPRPVPVWPVHVRSSHQDMSSPHSHRSGVVRSGSQLNLRLGGSASPFSPPARSKPASSIDLSVPPRSDELAPAASDEDSEHMQYGAATVMPTSAPVMIEAEEPIL